MKILRQVVIGVPLLLSAAGASAAWSLEPSYFLRTERNDNIYLASEENELAVTGGSFSPALKLLAESERSVLTGNIDLLFTRYQSHEELDRDEGVAELDWKSGTELAMYGADVTYARKSSLDHTLEFSGIDENVIQKRKQVAPFWRYQFSERWNFSLNLTATDVMYDEPGYPGPLGLKVVNFINFTEYSASLGLNRTLTENDFLSFTYYQSRYEGQSNGLQFSQFVIPNPFFPPYIEAAERRLDYDYKVLQVGYRHSLSEVQNINVQVGASKTDILNQTRLYLFDMNRALVSLGDWDRSDSNQNGHTYSVGWNYSGEIFNLNASASRNRVASSTGGLDETDTVALVYKKNLTERLMVSLDTKAEKHKPDEYTNVQSVSEYSRVNVSPSISYKFGKNWTALLGYRYSEIDRKLDDLSRVSNAIVFTMSWREPKLLSSN